MSSSITFSLLEITCSTSKLPDNVSHGSFDCPSKFDHVWKGVACRLPCEDGFYPASANQIACEAGATDQEGEWSSENFVCAGENCQYCSRIHVSRGPHTMGAHKLGSHILSFFGYEKALSNLNTDAPTQRGPI